MRRFLLILCLLPCIAAMVPAAPAAAAPTYCFPQVPDCITFRFAEFWHDNGGLPVFGLPLDPDHNETINGQKYKVQYFERFRFEYHKGDPKPYDVLLGRIGVDQLTAQGRDWQTFPKADPKTPHYFSETGHAIASQFWGFWSSNGLEFDGNKKAKSQAESLALFGFPISEAQMETGSDGQQYLTQWYERARFEYHPENKAPYTVLLGRLGADALAAAPAAKPGADPELTKVIGCPPNAPPVAEGAQAWMGDAVPNAPGIDNTICVRLTLSGAPVQDAKVKAVAHYSTGDVSYEGKTGADGQAELHFNIGRARNRSVVKIDVSFKSADGHTYTAATSFRPVYAREGPPAPVGPVLTNIPAPTGNCVANAPPPVEGAQAWMTNYEPTVPGNNSICARLIIHGVPVNNAEIKAVAYVPGKDNYYGPVTTKGNGVAEIGFGMGDAVNHSIVYIDVYFDAPGDNNYTVTTYFRPNYPDS